MGKKNKILKINYKILILKDIKHISVVVTTTASNLAQLKQPLMGKLLTDFPIEYGPPTPEKAELKRYVCIELTFLNWKSHLSN